MDQLFPLIHFLDGSGSSFSHWCRMVKSQGAKPIIFVDSEYSIRVNQQIDDDSVPVIVLPDGREFENLIPEETYFGALSEITDIDDSRAKFKSWEKDEDLPPKMILKIE